MKSNRLTESMAFFDPIAPGSARASGSYPTGAIDAQRLERLVGVLHVGVLTSTGTVNMRFQHNSVSAGSHSAWADVSSASCITSTFGSADNGKVALLELNLGQNPQVSRYVRGLVTVAANSWNGAAQVIGGGSIYDPASAQNGPEIEPAIVF